MTLRGALPPLLLPPLLLVLVVLAGALIAPWRRRTGALLAGGAALGLLALATPMAAGWLRVSLEGDIAAAAPGAAPGAIIVLGAEVARSRSDVDVGPLTLERLRAAAALHRATGLPLLVAGGPIAPGDPPLAGLMARSLAEDFRVPVRWTEEQSRTTGQNAILSAALLAEAGIGAAYVVTHAWHLPRAIEEFARTPLAVVPAPVRLDRPPRGIASDFLPRADRLAESWWAIREWAGRLALRLGW
nr:YdcF family protein [Roseomonas rosulenta]